jgi:hypothetical protein
MSGPYHRLIDPPDLIEKIASSGELHGAPARNIFASDFPKVKAYRGPLPEGQKGFEFETDVEPDHGCPPDQAFWSNRRPGVTIQGNYAKIEVRVRKIVK